MGVNQANHPPAQFAIRIEEAAEELNFRFEAGQDGAVQRFEMLDDHTNARTPFRSCFKFL